MKYKNIVIAHHSNTITSLVEEELLNFLLNKSDKIYYITHPFKNSRDGMSLATNIKLFSRSKKVSDRNYFSVKGPEVLFFVKDLLFSLVYFLSKEKNDIFFGVDNLNALSGIILKKLGKVDKVVYYVIDYVPYRFSNPLLNKIYNKIDEMCVKYCDQTWNLSSQMEIERAKKGLDKGYIDKQITVPVGCNPLKINNKKRKNEIAFLGILNKDQGVENLVRALPYVLKKNSDIKLKVIGSGEDENDLKILTKSLKIEGSVEFLGFVKNNKDVEKILKECKVGVAPYLLSKTSFKYYTDPGKIKTYLGAGLPIIMTDISHISKVIKEKGAGIIIDSKIEDIAKAINDVFSKKAEYDKLQKNAYMLSKEFSWKNIFNNAFQKLEGKNV